MARLATRCEFSEYVLKKIGSPLLDVIIEASDSQAAGMCGDCDTDTICTTGVCLTGADTTQSVCTTGTATTGASGLAGLVYTVKTQLDYVIDDSLDFFREYGAEVGNEETTLFIQLEEDKRVYDVPESILAVQEIYQRGLGGSHGMGFNFIL